MKHLIFIFLFFSCSLLAQSKSPLSGTFKGNGFVSSIVFKNNRLKAVMTLMYGYGSQHTYFYRLKNVSDSTFTASVIKDKKYYKNFKGVKTRTTRKRGMTGGSEFRGDWNYKILQNGDLELIKLSAEGFRSMPLICPKTQ